MLKGSGVKTERLQLVLSPEEKATLERLAAADGRSMSGYVGRLVRLLDPEVQGHAFLAVESDCGRVVKL